MPFVVNMRELTVWKEAYAFNIETYRIIEKLPASEEHNLVTQMRRASTSVILNITEGMASDFIKTAISQLSYAYASAKELETCLFICRDLSYLEDTVFVSSSEHLDKVIGMLAMFKKSLEDRELGNKDWHKKKLVEEIRKDLLDRGLHEQKYRPYPLKEGNT